MSTQTLQAARQLVSFLSRHAGKPIVLDKSDCVVLCDTLGMAQVFHEAYSEAAAELDRLHAEQPLGPRAIEPATAPGVYS